MSKEFYIDKNMLSYRDKRIWVMSEKCRGMKEECRAKSVMGKKPSGTPPMPCFRLYAQQGAFFDKTFKLPDFELVK